MAGWELISYPLGSLLVLVGVAFTIGNSKAKEGSYFYRVASNIGNKRYRFLFGRFVAFLIVAMTFSFVVGLLAEKHLVLSDDYVDIRFRAVISVICTGLVIFLGKFFFVVVDIFLNRLVDKFRKFSWQRK